MRSLRAKSTAAFAVLLLVGLLLPANQSIQAQDPDAPVEPVRDLRSLLEVSYILQDNNEDEVIDFVDVRFVLPDTPTEAELVAAANIAARLGFEASAMDLDLIGFDSDRVRRYENPVIVIGARNALRSRMEAADRAVDGRMTPGSGQVSAIQPNAFFREGGMYLSGGDATGLIAASSYLSGRYPQIWDVNGATFADIPEKISGFLSEREAAPESIRLGRLVVDAGRPGVGELVVEMAFAADSSLAQAAAALEGKEPAKEAEEKVEEAVEAEVEKEEEGEGGAARREYEIADLEFSDLHRIAVNLTSPGRSRSLYLLPRRAWRTEAPASRPSAQSPDFTLSELYSIGGLFRDTNRDFVPDQVIAYLSMDGGSAPGGIIDLAARIGLESAGIRLPLVQVAGRDDYPESQGFPVLYGIDHYQTNRLKRENRLYGHPDEPGMGFLEFVPEAFGEQNGLVIGGVDEEGLQAVADYMAERMPYLWEYGKGNYHLADVENEIRRFFQVKDAAGETSLALQKLQIWLGRIADREIERVEVEIAAREAPAGLERLAEGLVRRTFPEADVTVATHATGFGVGESIFDEEFEIPWEVDRFWERFRAEALPAIPSGSRGSITVRVSESPEIREQIRERIGSELDARGIASEGFEISVLSAYKQGYSWLHDDVLPRIRGRDVAAVEITYHTLKDSDEVRWQTINADTRWLQELYPVDAVLARELGIPDSLITFRATGRRDPIYTVRVMDGQGTVLLEDSFDPKYVVRPFFDLFPEYESVRVTTGWVEVVADGRTILDERIATDPERFWDHLQQQTFARIIEYVMDIQEGRPSSANAPYFDEFRVELTLSEPNYRIGVDEEVISSVEALHEDIYFETLTLFNLLGSRYGAGSMNFPGRILPFIQPPVEGRPGRARISMTGRSRARPELSLRYTEKEREPVRRRYALTDLGVDPPVLRGITVKAGEEGPSRLLFEVTASDSIDRYEEFQARSSEPAIDRSFLAAETLAGMVTHLRSMHAAGIHERALSFDRVGEILFRFTLEDSTEFTRLTTLPRSRDPRATTRTRPNAPGYRYDGERIVQWEEPIGLEENAEILARLASFPGVNVYRVGSSFLGNDIFAADFLPPQRARYVAQAKLNALKPTLLISGRQHANEVSSTSHMLRLGELLVTDPDYSRYLKRVNVVLHPITNPDGTQLAMEMQRVNPDFMLHAGYLGALGVDATSESNSPDPRYPEAKVRPKLREMWLPDIYFNMHGYPSHEWVQYFAGYSAWVRNRSGGQRSWWSPRGWFIPGFNWIEDDDYPEIKQAQFAILDSIAAAITALPEVDAMNRRMYARYAKYGRQDVESFREHFHNGILVSMSLRGRPMSGSGVTNPRITYFSITTEAPDETARGDWLRLVCEAGLAHSTAALRYLNDGAFEIERDAAAFDGYVTRSVYRKKPVLPREEK
jgi:hypothetical protein